MKIFETVIIIFQSRGVIWPQKYQKNPFNVKNLLILFILVVYSILTLLYFLLEARTFTEYANSFFTTLTTFFCSMIFAIVISKTPRIFKLIDNLKAIVHKRKLTSFKKRKNINF